MPRQQIHTDTIRFRMKMALIDFPLCAAMNYVRRSVGIGSELECCSIAGEWGRWKIKKDWLRKRRENAFDK